MMTSQLQKRRRKRPRKSKGNGEIGASSSNYSTCSSGIGRNATTSRLAVGWDMGVRSRHFLEAVKTYLSLVN